MATLLLAFLSLVIARRAARAKHRIVWFYRQWLPKVVYFALVFGGTFAATTGIVRLCFAQ